MEQTGVLRWYVAIETRCACHVSVLTYISSMIAECILAYIIWTLCLVNPILVRCLDICAFSLFIYSVFFILDGVQMRHANYPVKGLQFVYKEMSTNKMYNVYE